MARRKKNNQEQNEAVVIDKDNKRASIKEAQNAEEVSTPAKKEPTKKETTKKEQVKKEPAKKKQVKNEMTAEEQKNYISTIVDNGTEKLVDYTPGVPKLLELEKINSLIDAINDRNSDLVLTEDDISSYSGRNGVIPQLRKFSSALNEIKVDVHRRAKASYSEYDKTIDQLNEKLNSSISNLSKQIEDSREKKRIEKLNIVTKAFKDTVNVEFADEEILKQNDKIVRFDEWFETSSLRLSDKQLHKSINDYIFNKIEDFKKYSKLVKDENNDILSKLFNEDYDGNAEETYFNSKTKTNEIERITKEREEKRIAEEAERRAKEKYDNEKRELDLQKAQLEAEKAKIEAEQLRSSQQVSTGEESQQVEESEDNVDKTVEVKNDSIFFFAVYDVEDASKVKDFLDEQGIDYDFKKKVQ